MSSPQLPPLTVDGLVESRRRYREQQQQLRDQRLQSVFKAAVTLDPNAMAEAKQIAERLGAPLEALEDNLDVAREMLRVRELRQTSVEFPSLDKRLAKLDFAGLAHDDLGNIKMVESTLDWMRRHWRYGSLVNERGAIGSRMADKVDTADDARRLQEIDRTLSEGGDHGFVAEALRLAGQFAEPMAKSALAGGAAAGVASAVSGPGAAISGPAAFMWGFRAAYVAQGFQVERGNEFVDMLKLGYDRDTAWWGASFSGAANSIIDAFGVEIALSPLRKAVARRAAARLGQEFIRPSTAQAVKTLAKDYATSVLGEAATEGVQEIVNVVAEEWVRRTANPELPPPTADEVVARVSQVMAATAKGMALLGLPAPAVRYISDTNSISDAKEQMRFLRSVRKGSEESKVRQKSPAAWAEHLRAQTAGTPVENVYVNGVTFAETLQQMQHSRDNAEDGNVGQRTVAEELDQLLPGTSEKIKAAVTQGPDADVVLSLADIEAHLAGTEIGERLLQHSRISPEANSFAEAQQLAKELEADQSRAQQMLDEAMDTNKAFVESAQKVQDQLSEQIKVARPTATPDQVRAEAVFYRNIVVNFASELKQLPEEFYAQHPYRIVNEAAAQTGDTEFDQIGNRRTNTPEFKAWFGDSKVVDAGGKPLVVYHGASRDFSDFDTRGGKPFAWGKLGSWFTANPEFAAGYGDRVVPVYVAIRNPASYEDVLRLDGDQAALIAEGFDGASWKLGEDTVVVAFEPTQVKSVNNRGTFDPNDPNMLNQADPAVSKLLRSLTPDERKKVTRATAAKVFALLKNLPSANEVAAIAEAGKAKRGWYRESARALEAIFGADAPRFAMLLAAMSPQTSVESNLTNALNTWVNWVAAGRPTERDAIIDVMAQSVQGKKGRESVLDAWINNSVRALTSPAPRETLLSGPKVNSFFRNLIGDAQEVTLDAWMANYALVDQTMFSGSLTKGDPGKRPGYLAFSARVREAAKTLTKLSGEEWTPAEVQETVWSWAKTLYELQNAELSATEALQAGHLTDDLINSTPDFSALFHLPGYAEVLNRAGYGERLDTLRSSREAAGTQPVEGSQTGSEAGAFAPEARRGFELRAARRLDKLYAQRRADERARAGSLEQRGPDGGPDVGGGVDLRGVGQEDGGRPSYGTPRDGSDSVLGVHYSRSVQTTLNSARYGTGMPGAERRSVWGHPILSKRIHFYTDTGSGIAPESGVGGVRHEVQLNNVYNTDKDPLGLVAAWRDTPAQFVELELAIVNAGFDGIYVPRAQGTQGVAVLLGPQHSAVPVQAIIKDLEARSDEGPKGRFNPKTLTTILMQKADTSTFLHETAHYYLTVLSDLASRPDATPRMRADMQTLLNWFGVADLETWNAMSLEEQRKHHEAFAYSFETYMFEGKAPTRELKTLFDKFATWLRTIYKSIRDELNEVFRTEFGEDLPILTGEVRAVMDRMVASEEAVTAEIERRGMLPYFLTQEEAGMTDEAWAAYQQLDRERKDEAIAAATRDDLRNLSWLDGAEGRLLKAAQKENAEVRKRIRAEEEAAVLKSPRDRVQKWLKSGTVVFDDGTIGTEPEGTVHKLDRETVEKMLPAGTDLSPLNGMLKKGGLHPDHVAETFPGTFATGRDLVAALMEMRPFDEVVDARVQQRMLAENAELVPGTPEFKERINLAIHNEAHARFVAAENRHLQNSTKPVRVMIAAAKEAARRVLDKTPVGQVDPKKFLAAEARIIKQIQAAQKKGDKMAVLELKRRELLHTQLVRLSYDAKEEITAAKRKIAPIWRPDTKVATQRNLDLVLAARWILSKFGLATETRAQAAATALARVKEHTPDALAEFEPILADAAERAKPFEELTLQEFRDMTNLVQWFWQRSKRDQEIDASGKRVLRKEAITEMVAAMREIHGDAKLKGITTDEDRRALTFASTWAKLKRVESWARQMDGGKPDGPVTRYLWRPLRERYDAYMLERERLLVKVRDDLQKLPLDSAKIAAPELKGAPVFNGTAELLGAMQHAGNSSNLRRLLLGYQWADPLPENGFDRSGWDAFVQRMTREGILTKEHFDYLQSVWDLNENELRPIAQKVNREVYGLFFEQIPAEPIETPWGVYRGGYMPAKPDPHHPGNADIRQQAGLDAIQQMEHEARSMLSSGRAFTLTRAADVRRPLLLDVRLQVQHLDEVLRFVYMQPALRDVTSILKDPDFAGYLNAVDPAAIKAMLLPWLEDVAQNRVTKPSTMPALDKFFGFLRRSTGLNFMFASMRNAAQQFTGLSNVLIYVKGRFVKAALMRYYTTPGVTKWVTERSKAMKVRLENQIGQVQEDIDLLLDPSWMGNLSRWTNRHGYFAQRFVQGQVDVVAWLAAYQQELDRLGVSESDTEGVAKAIAEADTVVRLTQGSMTPADTAAYERSSAFARLFTQFSSYFNSVLNQIASAPPGSRARAALLGLVLPALGAATIAAVASGGDEFDDKDGDGYSDEVIAWLFATQARAAAGLVPGFGPLLAQAASGDRRVGDRLQPAPAWSTVQALARAVSNLTSGDPQLRGRQVSDLFTVLAVATGLPIGGAGRSLGYYVDVAQGRVVPRDTFDFLRGVASGRPSAGTRQ